MPPKFIHKLQLNSRVVSLAINLHKQKITWEIMNVGGSIVQHVSELSFDFFSNCQGFVLIPQNVLRLLVSCVIKIKVKGRE